MNVSIFLPNSTNYHALEDFRKLSICHKITTIFFTSLVSILTAGICSVATFRYLVGRFTLIQDALDSSAGGRLESVVPRDPIPGTRVLFSPRPLIPNNNKRNIPEEQEFLIENESDDNEIEESDDEKPKRDLKKESLNVLAAHIQPTERIVETIDTGDCFFDAVAKGLSSHLGRTVSLKEIRMVIASYVKEYERFVGAERNWIQNQANKNIDCDFSYDNYKKQIDFTAEEIKRNSLNFLPIWGNPMLEGRILTSYYGITLHMQEVTEGMQYQDYDVEYEEDRNGFNFRAPDFPLNAVIKIGNYRNHYLAILNS